MKITNYEKGVTGFLCDIIRNGDAFKFQSVADTLQENGGLLTDVSPYALQNFKQYEKEYGINTLISAFTIYNAYRGDNGENTL